MDQDTKGLIDSLGNQSISQAYKRINEIVFRIERAYKTKTEVQPVVDSLSFENGHERLIKLDLINKFKLEQFVIPILKSEDIHLIKIALKFHWYFEGTNIVSAKDFLDCVFPHTSLVVQKKILNQFAVNLKNETLAQEFFSIMKQAHGVSYALFLLPACGLDFFQKFINESYLDVPSHILLKVLHKYPSLIVLQVEKIFQHMSEKHHNDISKYRNVLQELAHYYPEIFHCLYGKYKNKLPMVHLGRRSSRKFIQVNKEPVLKSPKDYICILQRKKFYKNFSPDELKALYIALFPKRCPIQSKNFGSLETYVSELSSLLKYIQPVVKQEDISSLFYHVYGQSITELITQHPELIRKHSKLIYENCFPLLSKAERIELITQHRELITKTFFPLLSKEERIEIVTQHPELITENFFPVLSKEERIKVAEAHANLCIGTIEEYRWICYYETEKSIPLIKQFIIEAANADVRESLIPLLVQTCSANEDFSALRDVCEYFTNRYRNDDVSVRAAFVQRLLKDFRVQVLSDEHWKFIDELIQIFIFNRDFMKCQNLIIELLEESIIHGLLKQESVLTNIENFLKLIDYRGDNPEKWNFFTKIIKYDKPVIIYFLENWIDPKLSLKRSSKNGVTLLLVKVIKSWNDEHGNDKLSVLQFPGIVDYIKETVISAEKSFIKVLISYVQDDLPVRNFIYSLLLPIKPEPMIVMHFLRYNLSVLIENWDFVNEYIFDMRHNTRSHIAYYMFLRKAKMFKVPGIFDAIVRKCKNMLQNEEDYSKTCRAILVLSLLISSAEFYSAVSQYYPSNERVDYFAHGNKEMFEIQKTIANCLKSVTPIHDLHILIPFCAGDYLKLVLKSLNHIFFSTAETSMIPFLHILSEKHVSVKKHSVAYFCKILRCNNDVLSCLDNFWQTDSHPSIRRAILKQLLKRMHKHPLDSTWKLLKSCITVLTLKDKKSLELLTLLQNIPQPYKSEFFFVCWYTMIRIENEHKAKMERQKAEVEGHIAELERQKAELERQKTEQERQKVEKEGQKVEEELQKLDREKQKVAFMYKKVKENVQKMEEVQKQIFSVRAVLLKLLICDRELFLSIDAKFFYGLLTEHMFVSVLLEHLIHDHISINPLDSTWKLLKSCITALTLKDKKSLELLTLLQKIPKPYKSEFFFNCWYTMIRIENEQKAELEKQNAKLERQKAELENQKAEQERQKLKKDRQEEETEGKEVRNKAKEVKEKVHKLEEKVQKVEEKVQETVEEGKRILSIRPRLLELLILEQELFLSIEAKFFYELLDEHVLVSLLLKHVIHDRVLFLSLEDKFFYKLLNEHMFYSDSLLKQIISKVCAQFIVYSPSYELLDSHLLHAMTLFKNYVDKYWDTVDFSDVNLYPGRKVISGFIRDVCAECTMRKEEEIDKAVIFQKFLEHWRATLTPDVAFGDYILLELYCQYYSMGKEKGRVLYAKKLITFFEQILSKYGEACVPLITKKLAVVTSSVFHSLSAEETEKELELLEKLILSNELSVPLMIILNMFKGLYYNYETKEKFSNILFILEDLAKGKDMTLNLMLHRWIGKLAGY